MDFPRRPADRRRLPGAWSSDPDTVDGYRLGGLPWPIETTRHAYLTVLGGFSPDLEEIALGLNRQALEENTDLQAGDRVTVSTFYRGRPVPLLVRPTFQLVPLDFETPDAFLHSTEGEAVLPEIAAHDDLPGLEGLESGIEIVINGVLAARTRASRTGA